MSLLTDFLQKPYPGFTSSGGVLTYAASAAEIVIDSTGAGTASGKLTLKNRGGGITAGPLVAFQALNAASALVTAVQLQGYLPTNTAGAENSSLLIYLVRAGVTVTLGISASARCIDFPNDGQWTLGTATSGVKGMYLANAGVTGSLLADTPGNQVTLSSSAAIRLAPTGTNPVIITTGAQIGGSAAAVPTNLAITGTIVGSGATGYGAINSQTVSPGSITNLYAGYAASPTIGTTGTLPTVANFYALGGAVSGAGAITTLVGFYAGAFSAGTNNYGFRGALASGTNVYNLYMDGTADNYIGSNLGINVLSPIGARLKANDTSAGGTVVVFQQLQSGNTGDVLTLFGQGSSTSSTLLRVSNGAGVKVYVRGDGATMIGTTTQGATSALLTLSGRLYQPGNVTFDLSANTLAVTQLIDGSMTVGAGLVAQLIRLDPTVTLTGASPQFHGFKSGVTVSASTASALAIAANLAMVDSGAGAGRGAQVLVQPGAGHTGTSIGVNVLMVPQATSGTSYGVVVNTTGVTARALSISGSGGAGDQYTYAVLVDSNVVINSAAYCYSQRAGNTGLFLQYIDSGATTRFQVDANGDMTFGGSGRRIKGDLDNATRTNRLAFQSSSVNGNTAVGAMPNGAGQLGGFAAYAASNPDASASIQMLCNSASTVSTLNSTNAGATTYALELQIDGVYALRVQTNKDVCLGPSGASTASTAGFPFIPQISGAPAGTPTARAGYSAIVHDTTNNKFWVHNGTSWKSVVLS
jgi:hypothetical protein